MSKNTNGYFSVSRAQWQHIGFDAVHKIRAQQANENAAKLKDVFTVREETGLQKPMLVLEDLNQ